MMEEIAFSEWSERMDIAGSNHWLPAYGFQQPTQLQQALLQQQDRDSDLIGNDGGTVLIAGQQQQFLFLETIVEETSDDLRSESDRSGPAGWPDSDSDTESVIHVPNSLDCCDPPEWSGSERDLAVPKKRRRRAADAQDVEEHDDAGAEPDAETASLSSRSSSLLQFECLEKHCEDVFRTSATNDPFQDSSPFPPPSPSVMSSFSFDSLESNRWRFSASPDSLDDLPEENSNSESDSTSSDEGASSDDTLQHSSWSSRSSFRSSNSRLRSFRSFDSLNLLQPPQHLNSLAELSQSLTSNSFLLHQPQPQQPLISVTTADLSTSMIADATRSPQAKNGPPPEAKGISNEANSAGGGGGGKETAVDTKPQRSAENLSEDSGFGDHCIPAGVASSNITTRCNTVGTIVEDEDSCSSYYSDSSAGSSSGGAASSETSEQEKHGDRKPAATATKKKVLKLNREFEFRERRGWDVEEAKFNSSCWQSAPSLLLGEEEKKRRKEERLGSFPVTESVYSRAQDCQHLSSVPDILVLCQGEERLVAQSDALSPVKESADENADKELNTCKMSSRFPILSTPNLIYSSQEEFLKHEQRHSSMTRVPLKSFGGSNSEVDHLVVKEQTSKSLTPLPTSGAAASKGVHFCPVVSEVSWRDSYSDDDDDEDEPQDDRDEDETDEEMEKALVALEKGEDVGMSPKKQMLTLSKIQIGVPVGPGSTERERVVMELSPVTPTSAESHVVVKAADTSNSSTPAVHSVSMEKEKEPSESSRRDSSEGSKKSSKFGGFFQRFSLRRLSGRVGGSSNASSKKQQKEEKKKGKKLEETSAEYEDVTIIPLHPPAEDNKPAPDVVVSSKPPLPPLPPRSIGNANKPTPAPRRRPDAHDSALPAPSVAAVSGLQLQGKQDTTTMSHIDPTTTPPPPGKRAAGRRPPLGLLETDLDTDISTVRPHQNGAAPSSKKARSLLNLGEMSTGCLQQQQPVMLLQPPPGGSTNRPLTPADSRAKSMEFLLDKENQAAVQPPENELQKGGAGERVMSEHQLRVQRSLQKLNVPDWYKNSNVARGPEGFLLKRGSDGGTREHGWPGLGSKTTSLSSLGSTQSAAARSPTSHLLSPSPTPHVFTRWSTSRLNSGGTSASTSPCGSTRSSFNYRQPYLGWRSQERLSRPRTPAERLAAGLLPTQQQQQQQQIQQLPSPQGPPPLTPQQDLQQLLQQEAELEQLRREDEEHMQQVPNLSEVRTSIKEVTSAIVHYVSGVRDGSGEALAGPWDSLSPPLGADWGTSSTPRGSPRGSSGRLCWLESSFVGSRPLDSPETPLTLTSADVTKTLESLQQQQQQQQEQQQQTPTQQQKPLPPPAPQLDGDVNVKRKLSGTMGPSDLYLDLNSSQRIQNYNTHHQVNGEYLLT